MRASTSIVVRIRRTMTEDVHVSVEISDSLMAPEPQPDGTFRVDVPRLFEEALRIGREDPLDWRIEGEPAVEVHPLQTPPDDLRPPAIGAIARRWLDCFAAHDLDGLLALYAEDAIHTSPKVRVRHPETGGVLRGKLALRAWWADAFARLPDLGYELSGLTVDRARVFMEYMRRVPGEPELPVAEVLDIEGALIVASRVYHG